MPRARRCPGREGGLRPARGRCAGRRERWAAAGIDLSMGGRSAGRCAIAIITLDETLPDAAAPSLVCSAPPPRCSPPAWRFQALGPPHAHLCPAPGPPMSSSLPSSGTPCPSLPGSGHPLSGPARLRTPLHSPSRLGVPFPAWKPPPPPHPTTLSPASTPTRASGTSHPRRRSEMRLPPGFGILLTRAGLWNFSRIPVRPGPSWPQKAELGAKGVTGAEKALRGDPRCPPPLHG